MFVIPPDVNATRTPALASRPAFFGASTPRRLESSDNDFQNGGSESFRTLDLLRAHGHRATQIGQIVPGEGAVRLGPPLRGDAS